MMGAGASMGAMIGGPAPLPVGSVNVMNPSAGAVISSNNSTSGPGDSVINEPYLTRGVPRMMNPAFFQAMMQNMNFNQRYGGNDGL